MSITDWHKAEIRRLFFGEHWKIGAIASLLGLHDDSVRRVVDTDSFRRTGTPRASALDPYVPFMQDTLQAYPRLTATRLHEMLRARGCTVSAIQVRRRIRKDRLRPKPRSDATDSAGRPADAPRRRRQGQGRELAPQGVAGAQQDAARGKSMTRNNDLRRRPTGPAPTFAAGAGAPRTVGL